MNTILYVRRRKRMNTILYVRRRKRMNTILYVSCRSCEWFEVLSWALGFPVWEDNWNDTVWRYASESCHPIVAFFQFSLQERKVSHLCVVAFLVHTMFSPDLNRLCFAPIWADCVLPWFECTFSPVARMWMYCVLTLFECTVFSLDVNILCFALIWLIG